MVGPVHLVSVALGVAFALGFMGKRERLALGLVYLALGAMTLISGSWLLHFISGNAAEPVQVFTGGFRPPFSINLQMGYGEALFTLLINAAGLLGALYMHEELKRAGKNMMIILLVLFMGLNVMVMTRDLFNLFVFMEIQSIAIAGLIIISPDRKSIPSGFKYVIATGLISGFLLLGTVFAYYFAGVLNIDLIIGANLTLIKGGATAAFLIILAVLLELKPFPANGWALDVYEGAHPGVGALISAASATAGIFVLDKVLPLGGEAYYTAMVIAGMVTFLGSNLLGLKQTNPQRLLGYSSVGQIGLIAGIIGLTPVIGETARVIAFGILLTHFLAKAGLFWIAGIINADTLKGWAVIRRKPWLLVLMGTFVFALIGFPPFPSFFAKWQLMIGLAGSHDYLWLTLILAGSFLEAIYLFRWLGHAIKEKNDEMSAFSVKWNKSLPVIIVGAALYVTGYFAGLQVDAGGTISYLPLLFIALIYALDFLPAYIKNSLSIIGLSVFTFLLMADYQGQDMLRFIFTGIFLIGGILTLVAGYAYKGRREGFYPVALLMYAGLAQIIAAENLLQFFFGWEIMTAGSYFLIIRGKRSVQHALSYMLFSTGGAYTILAGFALAQAGQMSLSLDVLGTVTQHVPVIFALILVGFLTKTAVLGLHIWLPGAHAEAESDVSPMVSAILLKAGVFGIILLLGSLGKNLETGSITYILGWAGALTVLIGNMGAVFQEDAKRLLAYSSIGQLGYIVFAFSMMTHLGWLTGFTFTLNHFMYKAILFLTIGAIVLRVGTHNMYEMGGLIKKMPLAFVAVLIGIIALSGVPPLSGFGAKWLLYNAVILKGWYFQGIIVFFAGIVAFLYLFKLISSVFLGQLKDNHRNVKEISVWFLIPIYILIIGIMVFSARPDLILKPIGNLISEYLPEGALTWTGTLAATPIGYWNGPAIMITVGIMFVILLGWLMFFSRKAQKVKQFNIVYSGERPFTPETTHVSYNMFAGYNKALGFMVLPGITNFWNFTSDLLHDLAGLGRRIYGGNGQTYMVHIVLYTVVLFFLMY
jgi:formate hydrogenlyase subunit 3/multisubunit Na+/H+ antiporter MnhD subunit